MMKKVLAVVLSLFILVGVSSNVFAIEIIGELDYWESNVNNIASFMSTTPDIYSATLGAYNLTTLRSQVTNARDQWYGAGIPCNTTTTEAIAEIKVYGGSLSQIQSVCPEFQSGYAGLTKSYSILQSGVYLYNGNYKQYYKMDHATVYVKTGLTYPQFVVTHEIGHSIGWNGHISTYGNVMYASESPFTDLTARDKRHLSQIH
jgi:hypothetical protein